MCPNRVGCREGLPLPGPSLTAWSQPCLPKWISNTEGYLSRDLPKVCHPGFLLPFTKETMRGHWAKSFWISGLSPGLLHDATSPSRPGTSLPSPRIPRRQPSDHFWPSEYFPLGPHLFCCYSQHLDTDPAAPPQSPHTSLQQPAPHLVLCSHLSPFCKLSTFLLPVSDCRSFQTPVTVRGLPLLGVHVCLSQATAPLKTGASLGGLGIYHPPETSTQDEADGRWTV